MIPTVPQEKQNPAPPDPPTDAAYALESPKNSLLSIEDYASAIASDYAIDPMRFKRLITCESRWKADAAGDGGTSLGILQFKAATFSHFTKKYNLDHYEYVAQNPYQQIDIAARMIADGYLSHWKNCARKTGWMDKQLSQR